MSTIKFQLKNEVQKFENLTAPQLEYRFSRRNFFRPYNSKTGIYGDHGPQDFLFQSGGDFTFQDKVDFFFQDGE